MNFKKTIFIICILLSLLGRKKVVAQNTFYFNYSSDAIQTWTVPGCVTQVTVQLWGGGGAGVYSNIHMWGGVAGGSGAYYEGVLSGLTVGTVLDLYVPSGGKYSDTIITRAAGGWPGGGEGGKCHQYFPGGETRMGGGGGGYAAIQINGTYYVVVGAGGGASLVSNGSGYGGTGGATTGGNGGTGLFKGWGGYGGTIVSGGDSGHTAFIIDSGSSGSFLTGGRGGDGGTPYHDYTEEVGGGGGAGYYGGGGGGDDMGGGGSSYPNTIFSSGGITFTPISNIQGNTGNNLSNYLAPGSPPDSMIGMGGSNINGGNGLIIIYTGIANLTSNITVKTNPTCGICNGSLSVNASGGGGAYTYSWSPSGQTTATATGLCAGTYTVTVSDSCGDVSTASVVLVAVPLSVAAKANANDKCNGNCTGSATATVGIGTSPYTYTWAPSGGTKATATGLCAGIYTITVTDINGCTGSALATITQPTQVMAKILTITDPLCNAGTGSVSASASGGVSPYTYKWNPGNQTTAAATGLIAGTYTLTVSDSSGCTATTKATITQPTLLTATISATNYVPCSGGVGNTTVTAGGGTSPYTYLWSPGAQSNATATGLIAGVYTIKVTDDHGCTATNTVTITQPAILATTTTSIHAYCNLPNGTATASVNGGTGPYTYLWSPSAETNALATALFVGTYTVSVTDAHHCSASATVTITQPTLVTAKITSITGITCNNTGTGSATVTGNGGSAPYTYLWTPSAETTATATGLFAVSYTVKVTDANGCSATATTTLTQPAPITAFISEPKIICKDSTGILIANPSGGTPGYKYAWSSGGTLGTATITPTFSNDYSVTVTDANGCTATANIVLQYGPSFAVDIIGKRSVCVGDSTIICANAIGAIDGVTYLWEPENTTNQCIHASPALASIYTVIVVDGCGSTTTANTTVYTEPTPVVNMNVNFSRGCVPFCVQFLNNSTLSKGKVAQYVWSFGNGDSSYTKQPVYCYKTSGEYNVSLTVISDSGCSATLKRVDMLTIYGPPKAAFTYSPQPVSIEAPRIQFIDQSTDVYGIAYQWWAFGDGSDSTSKADNPIHTYHDTGTYCATLIVMNNGGCMDTVTNCLVIGPAFKLYIPSAFTPNGDSKNEVFQPVGQYVKGFEMYVFDRWGMELFHSTNINQGWNGTYKGSISQEDVYIYKITVMDSEDNLHSYVGNVTLLK